MKSIEELTSGESLWPTIEEWIANANTTVKVLPQQPSAEAELLALQVTTRSALGAIAFNCGGILIDHRWLRLLAAGAPEVAPSIGQWNGLLSGAPEALVPGALVCAWDVLGGIYVINGDRLPFAPGSVCYFGPESLNWFDLQMGHGAFVNWCLAGRLAEFYKQVRWPNWGAEVSRISADKGLSLYPPPWATEGKRIESVSRRVVPALELVQLQIHVGREIGDFDDVSG